jgi:hypothetical protein
VPKPNEGDRGVTVHGGLELRVFSAQFGPQWGQHLTPCNYDSTPAQTHDTAASRLPIMVRSVQCSGALVGEVGG